MDEPLAISPLWIERSGLPAWLNAEVRAGAWSVFKKIVELDCQMNAIPDIVEVSPTDLGACTGLSGDVVLKILTKLRQKRLIGACLGTAPEEPALLQIEIPLKTPVYAAEVARQNSRLFAPGLRFRYAYPIEESPGDEVRLQQVVDLYFNNISMRINSFILDELRLVARRFTLDAIRMVFGRAGLNEVHDLRWAVRELIRGSATQQAPDRQGEAR